MVNENNKLLKWQRNYKLYIEVDNTISNAVVITSPLTITFSVIRSQIATAQTAIFEIYNLSESTRKKIFHDKNDTLNYKRIIFEAGYNKSLSEIFRGNLRIASSYRRGVDWITEIEAYNDYGIINGNSEVTFPANTTYKDAIKRLFKDMPNTKEPIIGGLVGTSIRGLTFNGNSWELINKLVGNQGKAYIDNEQPIVKLYDEVLNYPVLVVNASTGLLDTPKRQEAMLNLKMLFEPYIMVGQIVQVESLETVNNGQYEVQGIQHTGTISEAVGGQCTTTLTLWLGDKILKFLEVA